MEDEPGFFRAKKRPLRMTGGGMIRDGGNKRLNDRSRNETNCLLQMRSVDEHSGIKADRS
jgi:hypothetical protein